MSNQYVSSVNTFAPSATGIASYTNDTSDTWSVVSGSGITTISGGGRLRGASGTAEAKTSYVPSSPDYDLDVTFNFQTNVATASVWARRDAVANSGIKLTYDGSQFRLDEFVGGSNTQTQTFPLTATAGQHPSARLECRSSNVILHCYDTSGNETTPLQPPASAPTVSSNLTSGGSIATGTYAYVYTVLTGTGESTASPVLSGVAVTGPTGKVILTLPAVSGASGYNVYRSNGGAYAKVGTTATTTFNDTFASASGALPSLNLTGSPLYLTTTVLLVGNTSVMFSGTQVDATGVQIQSLTVSPYVGQLLVKDLTTTLSTGGTDALGNVTQSQQLARPLTLTNSGRGPLKVSTTFASGSVRLGTTQTVPIYLDRGAVNADAPPLGFYQSGTATAPDWIMTYGYDYVPRNYEISAQFSVPLQSDQNRWADDLCRYRDSGLAIFNTEWGAANQAGQIIALVAIISTTKSRHPGIKIGIDSNLDFTASTMTGSSLPALLDFAKAAVFQATYSAGGGGGSIDSSDDDYMANYQSGIDAELASFATSLPGKPVYVLVATVWRDQVGPWAQTYPLIRLSLFKRYLSFLQGYYQQGKIAGIILYDGYNGVSQWDDVSRAPYLDALNSVGNGSPNILFGGDIATITPSWTASGAPGAATAPITIATNDPQVPSFTQTFSYTIIATASMSVTPPIVPAGHAANLTFTLVGTSTNWGAGTGFVVSGASKVSQNVTDATHATVVATTSGPGTITISDGVISTNAFAQTSALFVDPPGAATSGSVTVSLTGNFTVWTQETAGSLFSVSGGSGASLGTPTVTTDTAATATLTTGTVAGPLTITDNSTGKTATFFVHNGSTMSLPARNQGSADLSQSSSMETLSNGRYVVTISKAGLVTSIVDRFEPLLGGTGLSYPPGFFQSGDIIVLGNGNVVMQLGSFRLTFKKDGTVVSLT